MRAVLWTLRLGGPAASRLALAASLGALAAAAAVGLAGTSAWLIARASQHPPVLFLMVAIVGVRAFGLSRGALRYAERLVGHDAALRILGAVRAAAVSALERILPGPIAAAPDRATQPRSTGLASGDLLERFVGDVDALQDLWVRVLLPYAAAALVGVGSVALVAALVPSAAAALAITLVAAAVIAPAVAARVARGAEARVAPLRAEYQTEALELLEGATELAVYGALDGRLARLEELDADMHRAQGRGAFAAGAAAGLAALFAGGATIASLYLGMGALAHRAVASENFAVVALLPVAVHELFAALAPAAHRLGAIAGSAARVAEVTSAPGLACDPKSPAPLPDGLPSLRVRGLTGRWPGGNGDVLRGLDLDLAPGTCTVIAGASGSGKSTLVAMLLRLVPARSGCVVWTTAAGSVDFADLAGDEARKGFGWCAQDAYLFASTIEANLRLAKPDASSAELASALECAGLAAWVASLPDGMATEVGEHGRRLSGGQRQRVALCRALLAGRAAMLFDEPTEHLDDETAYALAADIVASAHGRTTLVLTHRPELFAGADAVLFLEDGRLHRREAAPERAA